jgi:hypothetical protein
MAAPGLKRTYIRLGMSPWHGRDKAILANSGAWNHCRKMRIRLYRTEFIGEVACPRSELKILMTPGG